MNEHYRSNKTQYQHERMQSYTDNFIPFPALHQLIKLFQVKISHTYFLLYLCLRPFRIVDMKSQLKFIIKKERGNLFIMYSFIYIHFFFIILSDKVIIDLFCIEKKLLK